MKILIITYCTSSNCGTFLQAFGVRYGLQKLFPDASFEYLKAVRPNLGMTNALKADKKRSLTQFVERGISFIRNKLFLYWSDRQFKRANSYGMSCFSYDDENYRTFANQYDLIVTGSDTILDRMVFNGKIGVMWGRTDITSSQILYAASGDDCCHLQNLESYYQSVQDRLLKFKYLGVRDDMIRSFLIDKIGIDKDRLILQPDPTYNLPLSIFKLKRINLLRLKNIKGKIAIYHFNRKFKWRSELADKLKKMGYTLVTPEYDSNCSLSLGIIHPFEWGALFAYCDVVFTERFHDTIFSLRHCKPVINFDWDMDKVNGVGESKRTEILKIYGLSNYNFCIKTKDDIERCTTVIPQLISSFNKDDVNMKNIELMDLSRKLLDDLQILNV